MRSCRQALRSGFLLASIAVCVSCNQTSRDCRLFIDTVNDALSEMHPISENGEDISKAVEQRRRLAHLHEELAQRIGELDLQDPEIRSRSETYRELSLAAANRLTRIATAVQAKDPVAAEREQRGYQRLVERESRLVEQINGLCVK